MSKKIVGALNSFTVQQPADGSWAQGSNNEDDRSWRLVYAEALDSISRSGPTINPWSTESPAMPFLVTPLAGDDVAGDDLAGDDVAGDDVVTDTVSFGKNKPRSNAFSTLLATEMKTSLINADVVDGSVAADASSSEAGFDAAFLRDLGTSVIAPQAGVDNINQNAPHSPSSIRVSLQSHPAVSPESVKPVAHATKSTGRLRDTSLSVRVTSLEATLLKRKAAEAGTTVSAYMRQCALDVERCRNEADETRAEMKLLRGSILRTAHELEPLPIARGTRSGAQRLAARALRLLGFATANV